MSLIVSYFESDRIVHMEFDSYTRYFNEVEGFAYNYVGGSDKIDVQFKGMTPGSQKVATVRIKADAVIHKEGF